MIFMSKSLLSFTSLLLVPNIITDFVECKRAVRGGDSNTNLTLDQQDNIPLELVAPMEFEEDGNETAVFDVIEDMLLMNITVKDRKGRNLQAWCGNGNVGNGACSNGQCCSEWGWCGMSSAHCTGTCGNGRRGNGRCSDGQCCSQAGWCGRTSAHCGSSPVPSPVAPPVSAGGTCGNGNPGNLRCPNSGDCCSKWFWCGQGPDYCSGSPVASPVTAPTPPSGSGATAYVTYHNYFSGESINDVACSDGQNGLRTRWNYWTLDPMIPYISAVSLITSWNSPTCGTCFELKTSRATIFVTGIDFCAPGPSAQTHFDLHPDAFSILYGSTTQGVGSATYRIVPSSFCRGNKG